ncbi:MAG: VCBS repeat-containing protein [Spartobacteria bacterium]|nr:VCBS repeat-containing protein [Spartobacteria bacterium]
MKYLICLILLSLGLTGFSAVCDFDGDGKTDACDYIADGGSWHIAESADSIITNQFGYDGTIPAVADYDGDGISDIACYCPETGMWHINQSKDGYKEVQFGYYGALPVRGDFDGDGKDDIAIYQIYNGTWYVQRSTDGFKSWQFGYDQALPIVGQFDDDGTLDYGVYGPANGTWFIMQSKGGLRYQQFGYENTVPVVGDYDGDGISDIAIYHADHGMWHVLGSQKGYREKQFGYTGTYPVPGDYDGDDRTDMACFYPPSQSWHVLAGTGVYSEVRCGVSNSVPGMGMAYGPVVRIDLDRYLMFHIGNEWTYKYTQVVTGKVSVFSSHDRINRQTYVSGYQCIEQESWYNDDIQRGFAYILSDYSMSLSLVGSYDVDDAELTVLPEPVPLMFSTFVPGLPHEIHMTLEDKGTVIDIITMYKNNDPISVPAGTFTDTILVDTRSRSYITSRVGYVTSWYAEGVGGVKNITFATYTDYPDFWIDKVYELSSYNVQ